MRLRRDKCHVMVTLEIIFKGEAGEKCHTMTLVDISNYGIDIRKWMGIWLEDLVEEESIMEG